MWASSNQVKALAENKTKQNKVLGGRGSSASRRPSDLSCTIGSSLVSSPPGRLGTCPPPQPCAPIPEDKPLLTCIGASLLAQMVKNLPAMEDTWVRSLRQEDPLEEEMATHSSMLAWGLSWTEKPGGLQSMGSQRVGHN